MLIEIGTGTASHKNGTVSIHVFACGLYGPQMKWTESHISQAAQSGLFDVRIQQRTQRIIAFPTLRPEMGQWYRGVYEVPEGTILKVFINKASFGSLRTLASQVIKMREGAAYRTMVIPLIDTDAAAIREMQIQGRFDLLTLEEYRAAGASVPEAFERQHDAAAIRRAMRIIETSPEIVPVAKTKTATITAGGAEVQVQVRRRMRDIID